MAAAAAAVVTARHSRGQNRPVLRHRQPAGLEVHKRPDWQQAAPGLRPYPSAAASTQRPRLVRSAVSTARLLRHHESGRGHHVIKLSNHILAKDTPFKCVLPALHGARQPALHILADVWTAAGSTCIHDSDPTSAASSALIVSGTQMWLGWYLRCCRSGHVAAATGSAVSAIVPRESH
jgi:hypothetical protein